MTRCAHVKAPPARADLREALVDPPERVQVGEVVIIERRIRELHNPPARRRARARVSSSASWARSGNPIVLCASSRLVVVPPEVVRNLQVKMEMP